MTQGYYFILDAIFNPILSLKPFIAEIIMAAIITFIITLFYRFLTNQNRLREIKAEQKEKQEKAKGLQKTNPEEANKLLMDVMSLSRSQFRSNFKPMFLTLIIVSIVLPWMAYAFPGIIVRLPFYLPYFENDFGWLMWYFIVSIPLGQICRKLVGVEL